MRALLLTKNIANNKMKGGAARTAAIRKRLAELRPEVEMRRQLNFNIARERQRRTFAANAQNLHDRYETAMLISPHMNDLRMARVGEHKRQLRKLLEDAKSFRDPALPLPAY